MKIGERIFNLERLFNQKSGMTKDDDTLPDRMLKEEAQSGAGKGHVAQLDKVLPKYYQLRGWDKNGKISKKIQKQLNLT